MLDPHSLAATLDGVNEAFFYARALSRADAVELVRWLDRRQYKSGPHAGLFAPTEGDYADGARLFTGEKLKTRLATRNVLGSEAARALVLLAAPQETAGILERLNRNVLQACYARSCVIGECAHSAVGLMRYLATGGVEDAEQRLQAHVQTLSQQQDGKGRWKRFPFYYTLLALLEIDLPSVRDEMRYSAPACERYLRRSPTPTDDVFYQRRRAIVQRVLDRCQEFIKE